MEQPCLAVRAVLVDNLTDGGSQNDELAAAIEFASTNRVDDLRGNLQHLLADSGESRGAIPALVLDASGQLDDLTLRGAAGCPWRTERQAPCSR